MEGYENFNADNYFLLSWKLNVQLARIALLCSGERERHDKGVMLIFRQLLVLDGDRKCWAHAWMRHSFWARRQNVLECGNRSKHYLYEIKRSGGIEFVWQLFSIFVALRRRCFWTERHWVQSAYSTSHRQPSLHLSVPSCLLIIALRHNYTFCWFEFPIVQVEAAWRQSRLPRQARKTRARQKVATCCGGWALAWSSPGCWPAASFHCPRPRRSARLPNRKPIPRAPSPLGHSCRTCSSASSCCPRWWLWPTRSEPAWRPPWRRALRRARGRRSRVRRPWGGSGGRRSAGAARSSTWPCRGTSAAKWLSTTTSRRRCRRRPSRRRRPRGCAAARRRCPAIALSSAGAANVPTSWRAPPPPPRPLLPSGGRRSN